MKIFSKLIFNIFLFLILVTPALAQTIPASFLNPAPTNQLTISSLGVSGTDNTVKGVLVIENKTITTYNDLIYVVELRAPATTTKGNIDGKQVNLVNDPQTIEYVTSEKFSLKSGEKKNVLIALPYQSTVNSGTYQVEFALKNSFGNELAVGSRSLNLTGSGNYFSLDPNSCIVKVNGTEYAATDGPLVNPNSPVDASCILTNQSSGSQQVSYGYQYARGYVIGFPLSKISEFKSNQVIGFGPKESKRIQFTLPAIDQPQVYEAAAYLMDSLGAKISPLMKFRWIVKGASAAVTGISLNKGTYAAGTAAQVTVNANPSVDLYWRGTPNPSIPGFSPEAGTNLVDPKIKVTILSGDNKECGVIEQALPKIESDLSWQPQVITVPITANCQSAKAKVAVSDSGQVLAEVEKGFDPSSSSGPPETQTPANNRNYWIIGGIILLVVVGIIIFLRKRNKPGGGIPTQPVTATTAAILLLIGAFYTGTSINVSQILPRQFEVRALEASSSATPVASSSVIPSSSPASLGLIVPWGENPPFANYPLDITKVPINNPPGVANITMDRNWSGSNVVRFFSNFQDFAQKNSSGLSQFRVNGECDSFAIDFSGYSGSTHYCDNIGNGVGVQAFIDGVNVPIVNPNSSNNYYLAGNELIVFAKPDSFRNASFTLNPPNLMAEGKHRIELIIKGLGVYIGQQGFGKITAYSTAIDGAGEERFSNCGEGVKSCAGKMDYVFSCPVKCPNPGETNPHGECDGFSCTQVNNCGVTKCGKNSDCGGCDNSNETRPHMGCVGLSCTTVDTCGTPSCTDSSQCCAPGEKNPHTVCDGNNCSVVNSCGVDGCTDGQTNPHGVCDGASCKQSNACGLTECSSGTDCFNDNMCKCDGFNADMVYPGNSFNFEAFAKVEGSDIKKADIADITFTMTQDNKIIAKSTPITPQLVESSDSKLRVKANWSTPPPPVNKNSIYRVFAQIKCQPKKKTLSANASLISDQAVLGANKASGQVLAASANSSPVPNASTDTSLQLRTLNFIKMIETDSCRSVIFKYDETLF